MTSILLPKAPKGYSYVIERDWDSKYHAVWLKHHKKYDYNTEEIKTIWGFLRKKDLKIYSPVNAKKVGKPAEYVTSYSAMSPPDGASCVSVTSITKKPFKKVAQQPTNALIAALY